MIKEKKKKSKYSFEKTKKQIIIEYMRTIIASMVIAAMITACCVNKARNSIIENVTIKQKEEYTIEKELAYKIINESDITEHLEIKSAQECIKAGEIFEIVNYYKKAENAYKIAIKKSKINNYNAHFKLTCLYVNQSNFDKAIELINSVPDNSSQNLIKYKTKSYLALGDKYYSIGKFVKASNNYEKAKFYYSKTKRIDDVVLKSIDNRIYEAYLHASDELALASKNSVALDYLKKAEAINKDTPELEYRFAILYSDADPELSVKYINKIINKIPQYVDYSIYTKALTKSAIIADLDNRPNDAKHYRYKIHSIDLYLQRKVIYKEDIELLLKSFSIKKIFFTYKLQPTFNFTNATNMDYTNLYADFILYSNNKKIEQVTKQISDKKKPLYAYNNNTVDVPVEFKKHLLTKKELNDYSIKIYIYKDKKFKTYLGEIQVPTKSIHLNEEGHPIDTLSYQKQKPLPQS